MNFAGFIVVLLIAAFAVWATDKNYDDIRALDARLSAIESELQTRGE